MWDRREISMGQPSSSASAHAAGPSYRARPIRTRPKELFEIDELRLGGPELAESRFDGLGDRGLFRARDQRNFPQQPFDLDFRPGELSLRRFDRLEFQLITLQHRTRVPSSLTAPGSHGQPTGRVLTAALCSTLETRPPRPPDCLQRLVFGLMLRLVLGTSGVATRCKMFGHARSSKRALMHKHEDSGAIRQIALLGNHLPRQCGIATFTTDLSDAISREFPAHRVRGRRDERRGQAARIPRPSSLRDRGERSRVLSTRRRLLERQRRSTCCALQHEYGIFGGKAGSHVLALLRELRMPIVTTLHTILGEPAPRCSGA